MAEEKYLRKVTDVDKVEEVVEGDTLILERDGVMMRVSANDVGGKVATVYFANEYELYDEEANNDFWVRDVYKSKEMTEWLSYEEFYKLHTNSATYLTYEYFSDGGIILVDGLTVSGYCIVREVDYVEAYRVAYFFDWGVYLIFSDTDMSFFGNAVPVAAEASTFALRDTGEEVTYSCPAEQFAAMREARNARRG